jgi:hypothetical protein
LGEEVLVGVRHPAEPAFEPLAQSDGIGGRCTARRLSLVPEDRSLSFGIPLDPAMNDIVAISGYLCDLIELAE